MTKTARRIGVCVERRHQLREELLNSLEFRSDLTDEARDLLKGMADLNIPSR
jgi:hypothetical protein